MIQCKFFAGFVAVCLFISSSFLSAGYAQDWPESYGPDGSGVVQNERKVGQLSGARLLWNSKAKIAPGRVADARRAGQGNTGEPHSGGFASPIVADGVVYMVTYRPSGKVYDRVALERAKVTSQQAASKSEGDNHILFGTDRWLVGASDVVTAISLKSGKTLWRRVIDDPGALNFNMFSKGGGGNTPAYADGKLYVASLGANLYCLDAKTGKTVWEASLGSRTKNMRSLKAQAMKTGEGVRFNRDMIGDVVVIDGVAITMDQSMFKYMIPGNKWQYVEYEGGSGLIAFDAKTGRKKWHLPKVHLSPGVVTWTAENGKRYIIANGVNDTKLIDPRTGRLLWKISGRRGGKILPVANEQWYVSPASDRSDKNGGIEIYQISLKGAKLVTKLPKEMPGLVARAVINDGKIYYASKGDSLVTLDAATGKVLDKKAGAGFGTSVEHDNAFLLLWNDTLVGMNGRGSRAIVSMKLANGIPAKANRWQTRKEPAIGYVRSVLPIFVDRYAIVRTSDGISCYQVAR